MIPRTSCEVNRNGWGVCERPLKLHLSRKGLSGKAKAKTGIGKSDLPGLQGGPRKRDFVFSRQSARASALSRPGGNCSVATVVISGGGAGDQSAESPEVKVLVGWVKTWSAPTGGRANRQVVAKANRSEASKMDPPTRIGGWGKLEVPRPHSPLVEGQRPR
jgi:hypothetical protein